MPGNSLRSQDLNVDPGMVPGFNNKPREHGDAGAVQEIQFPKVEYNWRGRKDQCFLEHLENRRVILRAAQAKCPFERDSGFVLIQQDVKRLAMNVFQAATPGTFFKGKTALVVTIIISV